jgi:hypothetical protein
MPQELEVPVTRTGSTMTQKLEMTLGVLEERGNSRNDNFSHNGMIPRHTL